MLLCRVVQIFVNVNSSEIAAECLKMFGVSDLAELVATRKGNTCPVAVSSARYVLFVVKFLFFSLSHFSCVFMLFHVLPDFGE